MVLFGSDIMVFMLEDCERVISVVFVVVLELFD